LGAVACAITVALVIFGASSCTSTIFAAFKRAQGSFGCDDKQRQVSIGLMNPTTGQAMVLKTYDDLWLPSHNQIGCGGNLAYNSGLPGHELYGLFRTLPKGGGFVDVLAVFGMDGALKKTITLPAPFTDMRYCSAVVYDYATKSVVISSPFGYLFVDPITGTTKQQGGPGGAYETLAWSSSNRTFYHPQSDSVDVMPITESAATRIPLTPVNQTIPATFFPEALAANSLTLGRVAGIFTTATTVVFAEVDINARTFTFRANLPSAEFHGDTSTFYEAKNLLYLTAGWDTKYGMAVVNVTSGEFTVLPAMVQGGDACFVKGLAWVTSA